MKFLSNSLKFAALSFGCVGSLASGQSTISLQPIAPVGAAAPGAGGNWTVIAPNAYISANNTVCFEATAGAAGGGIWYGNPDALELGVLNGDVAPGGGGATFTSAGLAGIAVPFNSGAGASLLKLSDLTDGIWSFSGGATSLRAIEGADAPDEAGAVTGDTFSSFLASSFNDVGNYSLVSLKSGPSLYSIHADVGGGLVRVLHSGVAGTATGLPANPTFSSITFTAGLAMNNNGRICFTAALAGAPATNNVVMSTAVPILGGGPTVVAQEGAVAPGSGGFTFSSFTGALINDNDDAVFRSTLDAGAPVGANTGLWHYDAGTASHSLVALEGGAAPETVNFFSTFEEWFVSNSDAVAFVANTVDGGAVSQGRGVWIDPDGPGGADPTELVAAVGGVALDSDGVTPLAGAIQSITNVAMNRNGDLLIRMTIAAPSVQSGLWIRPAGTGNAAVKFLSTGSTVYDETRIGKLVNAVTTPEAVGFTALGGGPVGRPNVLSESGEPLSVLTLDGSAAGLFLPTEAALTFFVAASSSDAAGTVGSTFQSIRPSGNINENGLAAFRGYLEPGVGDTATGSNDQGLWAEILSGGGGAPAITLVARRGSAAPGGGNFGQLPLNPIFNDDGIVAFNADIGEGLGLSGLWQGAPGSLQLVQRSGTPNLALLPDGAHFGFMRTFIAMNNAERIVSTLPLVIGTGNPMVTQGTDSVIVRFGSLPRLIAREGDLAGTSTAVFDDLRVGKPSYINNSSNVVFSARRKLSVIDGITRANQNGIWYHNGTTRVVVAAGSIPADMRAVAGQPGVNYLHPQDPVLNDGNRIAFFSTLSGAVTPSTNEGVFLSNAGSNPALLARTGSTQASGFGPQGIDPAATFASVGRPAIGAIGSTPQVLFEGNLTVGAGGVTAADDSGVWVHNGTIARLVAREGDFSPGANGAPTAAVFNSFGDATISSTGRVAFTAILQIGVGGVTATSDRGLWAETSAGNMVQVIREGTVLNIPVAGGGTRAVTVSSISIPGFPLGGANFYKSFSGSGFIEGHMTFTDGTSGSLVFLVP